MSRINNGRRFSGETLVESPLNFSSKRKMRNTRAVSLLEYDSHFSTLFTNSTAIGSPINGDFASVEARYVTTTCLGGLIGPQVISPELSGMWEMNLTRSGEVVLSLIVLSPDLIVNVT